MNLPNKLTILRILLIPLMVVLMYIPGRVWTLIAAAVFIAAAFTDYLDGHIARSRKLITDFGKFADPVADKVLVLSAMLMLIRSGQLPAFVVILILARELAVDGLRMVAVGKGMVIAAGKLGKIKTVSQMILVCTLMILGLSASRDWFAVALCAWVVIITLWSGIDYFFDNIDAIRS